MEEKKESVNVSPDPSEQRAPLSPSADEAQAASAGSAPMDPAKCGAHEIHCIEQEAELAEARVRERVRTEAAEAERALDNAAHCASAEQKSVLSEEQPDKAQNTRLSSAKSPAPSDEQAVLEAQNSANWKMTLVILTTASVLMSLSYTMLIPFLPMYLLEELHVAQEDVNLWSGLVFSVSFLISGVMAPIWGALADKYGRRKMLLRSYLGGVLVLGLMGVVHAPVYLILLRLVQGALCGSVSAAQTLVATHTPEEHSGFALGSLNSAVFSGAKVREYESALQALQTMGDALTGSLQKQWAMEQRQRERIIQLSHKLKTPLTIIEGNAELLAEDDGLTAEQKTQVESILQGAEQTRTYLGKIRAEVQTPLKYKTKKNDKTCRIVEN